ncbi:MAG TPA: diguanylate cyclase [Thermomonas sp.]|nr:diguanylate cyclase [Thermomonas sp.]
MHPKRLAIAALLFASAMPSAWAAGAASPKGLDLHRMGWLPSEVYDVGEGLPDPTVNAIATLPNGQVWLGTMRGLARQSGPRLLPEHGPEGALDGAILDLASTRAGDLLVASDRHGVWRLRGGSWASLGAPFGGNRVQRLRVIDAGDRQRVFAIGRGVSELVGGRWRAIALPPPVRGSEQFDIAIEAARGTQPETLWVASYGPGLYRCTAAQACAAVAIPGPGPRTDEIRSLQLQSLADGRSALWIGMQGGGVARLADGGWTRWHIGNSALPSDFVSDLELVDTPHGETEVWAGTRSGLAILRGDGEWAAPDPRVPLLRERVRSLVRARNSQGVPVLWIGADGGAVRMPLQGPWHLVSTLGKQGNGIWGLRVERAADGGERLWLGSDGEGLARYQQGRWRLFGTADGLPSNTVRSILRVPDGSAEGALWVGTWGGQLARLQGERFSELPTPWRKQDNEALSLLLAGPDEVWASTRHQGLAHWDGRQWQWWPPGPAMPSRAYSALRHAGDVWFSTADRGLARYRNGQWRFFRADIGLPDDALYDMRLIPERGAGGGIAPLLWIGSNRHGLLRVDIADPDRPRLVTTPTLPPLAVSYVYGAVQDGRGDLLVCTDYGVFSWRRTGDGFRSTAYHRQDGLPHDECNANAMQVDDQGQVWIGTVGGAAVYTPPDARTRRASPLQLTGLLVDGFPVMPDAGVLRLPRPDSTLELQYDLFSGEKEDDSRYRVALVNGGVEATAWSPANTHRYARLPAGAQRIRIEARDAAGIVAKPIELRIEVPQVWWRTPGARALQVLAALMLLWGLLKLRERQLHGRGEQLRAMVQERTAQLQKRESELRSANDELRRLSYTDPLTGLGNRRRLFETLELHWRDAARKRESLALLLIDLDHFKHFNDAHGHLAGDARLQQVARLVQSLLPAGASAARYGGEELCVLLPGHDGDAAIRVAERMRRAAAMLPADTALPEIEDLSVTASIGVAACVPGLEQRPDVLIARADHALYAAKAAGRNRVELAPPA